MITRSLTGTVEISTAALTVTSKPPAFTGENGALEVTLSFLDGGTPADISGYVAEMYLYWPERRQMTDSVTMTVSGSTASGMFTDALTVLPGAPLLIIQMTDSGTGSLIVACAQPIQITGTRADQVITVRPPTPSEIIYVGRSPYVDGVTGHWMEWDTDAGAYVDTGVNAQGDQGTSIVSITKTGTSGLVDTYTVLMSDGTTSTFTVTNGAQIQSVSKTGTSGLVDTYTVMMTNADTFTFSVTNGRGVSSIAKTSTSGLVDTYTVTYNDSTTSTFTVTNGNGISSSEVSYQAGTSGTIIPTGAWSPNPPAVAQGGYLWTKTVLTFDDATTETAYSVAYQGMDGSGSVTTVDGIQPVSGDVPLLTIGTAPPTSATPGSVGSRYFDKIQSTLYICTASSGGSQTWAPAGTSIEVDDQLDDTSANPVENSVITEALAGKISATGISLSVAASAWQSGQAWPGTRPLGESSSSTCFLATITTDTSGNPISCKEGDDFKVNEYSQARCIAPLWVYVGNNTIYVATKSKAPTDSVSIRGLILHRNGTSMRPATKLQDSGQYYQSGDTIALGSNRWFVTLDGASGAGGALTIVAGKKFHSGLTLTHTLTSNLIRANGSDLGNPSVTGVSKTDETSSINVDFGHTTTSGVAKQPVGVRLSGTITLT